MHETASSPWRSASLTSRAPIRCRNKSSRNAPLPSWVACMVGCLRVLRLPAARRPLPACCDRGANARKEFFGGERLGEIAIHPYFQRPYAHRVVGVGRDQNGGNRAP